ncbi:hypothetical protein HAX54_011983 [Datura stramonium]|uniref:Uncharacterized protein n=1 Tax=Datura stramonium TaxID=4076 RepID=A0ABS8TLV3_DATST|nr:hypothetical protein [Datura stramonium]
MLRFHTENRLVRVYFKGKSHLKFGGDVVVPETRKMKEREGGEGPAVTVTVDVAIHERLLVGRGEEMRGEFCLGSVSLEAEEGRGFIAGINRGGAERVLTVEDEREIGWLWPKAARTKETEGGSC